MSEVRTPTPRPRTATRRVRCVFPDRWLEARLEFPETTPLREVKRRALETWFPNGSANPDDHYIEFREREVANESMTLRALGVPDGGVLCIRRYDLNHPRPFRG
jgi:hypothetical protein